MRTIRVAELFAGVGGFRLGLERANFGNGKKLKVVWSNQWEPGTKRQHASETYVARFGSEGHSNRDIRGVPLDDIPGHDLLVGGFPCQDYSVANRSRKGLRGSNGSLWWEIHRVLKGKLERSRPVKYLLLENVGTLLCSPKGRPGRDFAVILGSLEKLGYAVEWRVVNAADYGMPQRRRRLFIFGCHKTASLYASFGNTVWESLSVFVRAFPVQPKIRPWQTSIKEILSGKCGRSRPLGNAGIMREGQIAAASVRPLYSGPRQVLRDILLPENEVPEQFFIPDAELPRWKKAKTRGDSKHVAFPDPVDRPSRTIITSEGERCPCRHTHAIRTESGRFRRLVPVELERLNMFLDGHTEGHTDTKRGFLMGNALVVGVVEHIGRVLLGLV